MKTILLILFISAIIFIVLIIKAKPLDNKIDEIYDNELKKRR